MPLVDEICIYDDQSTDETTDLCQQHTKHVYRRPDGVPPFLEHEGQFRGAAWTSFELAVKPEPGDWVFCVDADEFLVSIATTLDPADLRANLIETLAHAANGGHQVVRTRFPEVFAVTVTDGYLTEPKVRTDGFWGTIVGNRLFKYRYDAEFGPKPMGCGSEPTYVDVARKLPESRTSLRVLHLGYALAADHQVKYERYSKLLAHGHADKHIESIVRPGRLTPWNGPWPSIRVGT